MPHEAITKIIRRIRLKLDLQLDQIKEDGKISKLWSKNNASIHKYTIPRRAKESKKSVPRSVMLWHW